MVLTQPLASSRSFGYGFKPKQNIPESQKTETWVNENIDWCISLSPLWWKQKADEYYNTYNGLRSEDRFTHITKTYGIEFPAGKIKHIPLIRPLINRVLSEVEERMFEFTAHAEDAESIEQKIQDVSGKLLEDIIGTIEKGEDVDKAFQKLEMYYKEEYKSEMEIAVQHFLRQYMFKHRLERSFSEAFLDKAITGMEFYRVKVNRIGEDPEFKVLKSGQLFYSDNSVKWINECDWAVYAELLTPTEILDKYGERMKADDVKKIESWLDMYHKDAFYKVASGSEMDNIINNTVDTSKSFNNATVNHKIAVYHCEWKSIRKINYLKNDNKYAEDAPFIKILGNEDLRELPRSRKQRVQSAYVQDLWEGIRIGDDIYVDQGRVKYPVRSMSHPSRVFLSYNGLTHNGKIKPYSLVGETQDLQDLYDILHWHKENLVALSGVKGSYMDLSQLPDFKTGKQADNIKMYMYYKKLGTAFIDRSKEGADKQFNQFPSYDDTLGAGLKAILEMITHLEDTAGRIIGINRQQLGQTQYFDGKSTMQQAIQNSSMVTEYMINEHDEWVERALTDLANAARVSYKEGMVGHYTDHSRMQQIFRLDSVNFPFADLGIHITNRTSDKKSIAELKMITNELVAKGAMDVLDILPMFRQTSLAEITREIQVSVTRRKIEMAEQQNQIQQMQLQIEKAKGEAEIGKLQAQIQEIMAKIELNKSELTLEERALDQKSETDNAGLALDRDRVALEAKQLEVYAKQNSVKSAEVKNK
jgi:hypothetical protein